MIDFFRAFSLWDEIRRPSDLIRIDPTSSLGYEP